MMCLRDLDAMPCNEFRFEAKRFRFPSKKKSNRVRKAEREGPFSFAVLQTKTFKCMK